MPNNIHRHLARGTGHTTAANVRNDTMSMLDKGLRTIVTKYAKKTTPQGRENLINRLGQLTDGMRQAANNSRTGTAGVAAMTVLTMVAASAITGKAMGMVGEAMLKEMGGNSKSIQQVLSSFGKFIELQTDITSLIGLAGANRRSGNPIGQAIADQLRNAFNSGAEGISGLRQNVQQVQDQLTARELDEMNQFINNHEASDDTASASGSRSSRSDRARTRMENRV